MARIAPSSRLEITANLGLPNRALFTQASIALLEVSRRRVGQEYQTRLHGGFEKPLGRFAIRAGGGLGPNNYTRVSGGFSAKIQILQVDYGFENQFCIRDPLRLSRISLCPWKVFPSTSGGRG